MDRYTRLRLFSSGCPVTLRGRDALVPDHRCRRRSSALDQRSRTSISDGGNIVRIYFDHDNVVSTRMSLGEVLAAAGISR
jgi:hypothetical protein